MTEINDDATVITLNRSRELAESQAKPRLAPRERTDFNALGASLSADVVIPADAPPPMAAGELQVPTDSAPAPAPDVDAGFRQTRLAVTAGLVVLLLVVWIWQRRSGLRR